MEVGIDSEWGHSEVNGIDTNLEQNNNCLIILFSPSAKSEYVLLTILSNILGYW